MEELRPREYRARWSEADEAAGRVVLLDVRENWELDIAQLPAARHLPMAQVPERLEELDHRVPVVVICRSGGRSAQVAAFLEGCGFERVFNLAGGINAWSQELDPEVPVY